MKSTQFAKPICCMLFMLGLMPVAHSQSVDFVAPWWDGFSFELRPGDKLLGMYSPYTYHFDPSPEHRYVWLLGLERERQHGAVSGLTYFSNSFGQPSTYVYPWGRVHRQIGGINGLYFKWSAGLIYGYVEPYENKVPLNVNGFSPAIIPSIGYEQKGYSAQVNWLGVAGLMFQFNMPLNR